jgi:hypothetical protein
MGGADASNRLRETALVLTKLAKRKFLLQLFFIKEKLRNGSLHITEKPTMMNRPPMKRTSLMDGEAVGSALDAPDHSSGARGCCESDDDNSKAR